MSSILTTVYNPGQAVHPRFAVRTLIAAHPPAPGSRSPPPPISDRRNGGSLWQPATAPIKTPGSQRAALRVPTCRDRYQQRDRSAALRSFPGETSRPGIS